MDFSIVENLITNFKTPQATSQVVKDLITVVTALFDYTKTIQTELDHLKQQTVQLKKPLMSSLFSAKTPEEQTNEKLLLHTYHSERLELINIKRNGVVSGIAYSSDDDDKTAVQELLEAVGLPIHEQNHTIRRIRNKDKSATNKILVTFESEECKESACRHAHKLRKAGSKFNNVYLNEDRTKIQRTLDKERRDERNKLNNAPDFSPETYDVIINGETVSQKRRLGVDNGRKFYWAIRNDQLKKIFIENINI